LTDNKYRAICTNRGSNLDCRST